MRSTCNARACTASATRFLPTPADQPPSYGRFGDAGHAPKLKELIKDSTALAVERHAFPNLLSLNFIVHGLLGDGVAASTRSDPQAKSFGAYVRAKVVDIPRSLLGE